MGGPKWDSLPPNEKPEKGKLVLFPSWLEHYVEPNLTNEDRISMSFDTQIHVYD